VDFEKLRGAAVAAGLPQFVRGWRVIELMGQTEPHGRIYGDLASGGPDAAKRVGLSGEPSKIMAEGGAT
jgi:hypothetical protein